MEGDFESLILKGRTEPIRKCQPQFGKIFLDILDKYHDLSALIDADTEEELTYGQIKEKSIRWALWFRKQGIGKGDVASLITDIRVDTSVFFLAAFYEGVTFNPWLPVFNLETARYMLKITKPKVVFCTPKNLDILKEACRLENHNPIIVSLDSQLGFKSLEEILESVSQLDTENYEPVIIDNLEKDVSAVFFTSGSTGMPKGVAHSYLSMFNNFIRIMPITYPNQKGRPTLLLYIPPAYSIWYLCFMTGLYEGGVYILHRNFDPVQTTKVINKYQVNYYFILPHEIATFVQSGLLSNKNTDLSSVEEFCSGSSVINPIIYDTFKSLVDSRSNVTTRYALTETAYGLTLMRDYKTRADTKADPIGFIEPNVQIKVVDPDTDKVVGPNQKGEMYIKLPHMFLGYYNDPEETKKAIDDEGWFHTGDLVYYDGKGEIFFVERLKDMIKYAGSYVMGSRIEQELLKHPDISEACVVPVPDMQDDERPLAFVKKRSGSKVTEDDVVRISSTLGDYNTLRGGVVFLDALPRLLNGKVAKVQLKQMAKAYECKYD